MGKYFMQDSRHAAFERMMMDPSRSTPIRAGQRKERPQKKPPCSRSFRLRSSERKIKEGGV